MTTLATELPDPLLAPDRSRRLVRLRPRLVPHFPAVVFILTTLLLPIGAINGQNNLLFWMFGLAIATLVGSGLIGAWTISSISVERDPIPTAHAGETIRLTYRITNSSRWLPAFAISVAEFPIRPRAVGAVRATPTWDRHFTQATAFAEYVRRGGTVLAHAEVAALTPGTAVFDTVEVWTTFPFGLSRKTVFHAREQRTIVRPPCLRIRQEFLNLLGQSRGGAGNGATVRPGSGEEFHSLRDMADGDPPRMVAWKRSAMADRLLVRQAAQPENRRLWLGLADLRGLPEEACDSAIVAASSVAAAASMGGQAVGFLGGAQREAIPPRGGPRALSEILDLIASLDPQSSGGLAPIVGATPSSRIVIIDPLQRPQSIGGAIVRSPAEVLAEPLRPRVGRPARPVSMVARVRAFLAEFIPSGNSGGQGRGAGE